MPWGASHLILIWNCAHFTCAHAVCSPARCACVWPRPFQALCERVLSGPVIEVVLGRGGSFPEGICPEWGRLCPETKQEGSQVGSERLSTAPGSTTQTRLTRLSQQCAITSLLFTNQVHQHTFPQLLFWKLYLLIYFLFIFLHLYLNRFYKSSFLTFCCIFFSFQVWITD